MENIELEFFFMVWFFSFIFYNTKKINKTKVKPKNIAKDNKKTISTDIVAIIILIIVGTINKNNSLLKFIFIIMVIISSNIFINNSKTSRISNITHDFTLMVGLTIFYYEKNNLYLAFGITYFITLIIYGILRKIEEKLTPEENLIPNERCKTYTIEIPASNPLESPMVYNIERDSKIENSTKIIKQILERLIVSTIITTICFGISIIL